jgi:hypothetical protein
MTETKRPNALVIRDFAADLAVCNAASSGPYRIATPTYCGCNCVITGATRGDGKLFPADIAFIKEAREGWPAALAEIARLQRQWGALKTHVRNSRDTLQKGDLASWSLRDIAEVMARLEVEVLTDGTE